MTRPVALRILVLAAGVGLIAQAVLLDNLLGVNAPILAALLLVAAFVLRPVDSRIDALDRWLPPAALAISASIAVRADPTLLALDLGAACVLLGARSPRSPGSRSPGGRPSAWSSWRSSSSAGPGSGS